MRAFLLFLLAVSFSLSACNEDEHPVQLTDYIQSVEVVIPVSSKDATVDNFTHVIEIPFIEGTSLAAVTLRLNLAPGVKMITPAETESIYNLTADASVVISGDNKQITYKIKPFFYKPDVTEVISGWEPITGFGILPAHLFAFKSPAQLEGKNAVAYIVVADMNKGATFDVIGEKTGVHTPAEYFQTNNKPAVIMNAGYFYASNALSLICRMGQLVCPNLQSMSRSDGVNSVPFYPTRSVFALKQDGRFHADWVYTADGITYAYPQPSPNKAGTPPQPQPSALFPAGATVWNARTAVGAGPMLLKDGVIRNTWEAELCDDASGIGATINNPRSAVGITRYNHLIFFVCEGRFQTPGVAGLTLQEVATVLKNLGCTDAINLDGGGSSCLLINGKATILPSDGKQRSVSSCITLN